MLFQKPLSPCLWTTPLPCRHQARTPGHGQPHIRLGTPAPRMPAGADGPWCCDIDSGASKAQSSLAHTWTPAEPVCEAWSIERGFGWAILWGHQQLFSVPVSTVIAHVSPAMPGSGSWGPMGCVCSSTGELCRHTCPLAAHGGHRTAQPHGQEGFC